MTFEVLWSRLRSIAGLRWVEDAMAQEPDGVTVVNVKLLPLVWIARTSTDPHRLSAPIKSVAGKPNRSVERVASRMMPTCTWRNQESGIGNQKKPETT